MRTEIQTRLRAGGTVRDHIMLAAMTAQAPAFLVFGLTQSPPGAILDGLGAILFARDKLITDYIG